MKQTTKELLDAMIANVLNEYRLEQQFLAVLRDPATTAGTVQIIEQYIEDALFRHPDRPSGLHVRLDRISQYVESRARLAGWKEKRDDVERQRSELMAQLADIESVFCSMLDADDEEDALIDDLIDDDLIDDDVPTLDEGDAEIWPRNLTER